MLRSNHRCLLRTAHGRTQPRSGFLLRTAPDTHRTIPRAIFCSNRPNTVSVGMSFGMFQAMDTQRRLFDTNLRSLATRYNHDFLTWLKGPQVTLVQELDTVVPAIEHRSDFLILYLDEHGNRRILHVEVQTVSQGDDPAILLPARMAYYALAVYRRYGQIPDQVLILLKNTAANRRVPNFFAEGRMRLEYDIIRLWEEDPQILLESDLVGLMPLVPLMRGEDLNLLLTQSTQRIEALIDSQTERNEVLTIAGLLGSMKNMKVVQKFYQSRSMMALLSEMPLFQALLEEKVQEKLEERLQEKLEEVTKQNEEATKQRIEKAEQRAKLEGGLQFLQHQLEVKFGALPPEVVTALQAITDIAVLDGLGVLVLTAPDLDTFSRQLPNVDPGQS
jgi:dihydroxyacetone kinase DhaKLM complex PTS-EIIA-like component DhaM